jgi:hypothetical protein
MLPAIGYLQLGISICSHTSPFWLKKNEIVSYGYLWSNYNCHYNPLYIIFQIMITVYTASREMYAEHNSFHAVAVLLPL